MNSKLQTQTFPAVGGGAQILLLHPTTGPAFNYVVKIELQEQTAGAGSITDGASLSIDIPATVPVGTRSEYSFGNGYRLGGDLVISGAGTRSGTVTYYTGP